MSVAACTVVSAGTYGTYWNNCNADVNFGVIRIGFYFDYENIQGAGGAKIDGYRNGYFFSVGGTLSEMQFSEQGRAAVRYGGTYTTYGGIGSWSAWMQVNVSNNTAWTTHN